MLKTPLVAETNPAVSLRPAAPRVSRPLGEYLDHLSPAAWASIALLAALLVGLYARIAVKLVTDWYQIQDDSGGFLIPFFVVFLVWDGRQRWRETPVRYEWKGITVVALALFVLVLGVLGADLFLSRTSFILLTAGLVWTLLGRPALARSRFILLTMLLAVPLPTLILNHITFPLQILASRVASDLLPLAGVPVLREGNVIQLPAMQLEVAEACSGIRSLMSLFIVAVIFGYFMERSVLRRTILAFAAIPIAVAANAMRIFGTGLCVQYWDPEKAMGFFHEFSGWLVFLVSLISLYLVHLAMNRWPRKGSAAS
ncbi:MAG: exosortase/archaeosortase family protein [Acidobacteriota bacterium]